jgi:nicotinamide phosphoribosyltransferase
VLHPKVRVIQGDGIDFAMLEKILAAIAAAGFSADNLAFGSGGGLLQKLNRDTQKFAFKCASVVVGDEVRDVYKQPITDPGKDSKRGRMKLVRRAGSCVTVGENERGEDELVKVFENGQVVRRWNWEQVRQRVLEGVSSYAAK